jgi:SAM-dependent methyltransferase
MFELLKGEALFGNCVHYYGDMSLIGKILVAVFLISALVALVMTIFSLVSLILSGSPFIATPMNIMRKIVALAQIQPGECVYDIGCGDGRFLVEANKHYGALAVGIDISPVACFFARLNTWLKRAQVIIQCVNFKNFDFSDADVVFCYLVPDQMVILGEKFKALKKGCRIISRRFEVNGQIPYRHIQLKKRFGHESIYIYRV